MTHDIPKVIAAGFDEAQRRDPTGQRTWVVLVHGNRAQTDVYCLGVKNVLGPDVTDELTLSRFLPDYYAAYPRGWQNAPIELAQHIVFGAVAYARRLGFEPSATFTHTADHLGVWEGPSAITFGKDGKPFYVSGPHDNPRKVIKTLEHTVGPPPNFDYVITLEAAPAFTTDDHGNG